MMVENGPKREITESKQAGNKRTAKKQIRKQLNKKTNQIERELGSPIEKYFSLQFDFLSTK